MITDKIDKSPRALCPMISNSMTTWSQFSFHGLSSISLLISLGGLLLSAEMQTTNSILKEASCLLDRIGLLPCRVFHLKAAAACGSRQNGGYNRIYRRMKVVAFVAHALTGQSTSHIAVSERTRLLPRDSHHFLTTSQDHTYQPKTPWTRIYVPRLRR